MRREIKIKITIEIKNAGLRAGARTGVSSRNYMEEKKEKTA